MQSNALTRSHRTEDERTRPVLPIHLFTRGVLREGKLKIYPMNTAIGNQLLVCKRAVSPILPAALCKNKLFDL
jgi:hypothetical protein